MNQCSNQALEVKTLMFIENLTLLLTFYDIFFITIDFKNFHFFNYPSKTDLKTLKEFNFNHWMSIAQKRIEMELFP
jgi:hypothetical protein